MLTETAKREYNRHLDIIAEAIGSTGASTETLNALHACRPGHPWNETAERPFQNLKFMLTGRAGLWSAIPHEQINWLRRMVETENDQSATTRTN